jgi:hypothetical protein
MSRTVLTPCVEHPQGYLEKVVEKEVALREL